MVRVALVAVLAVAALAQPVGAGVAPGHALAYSTAGSVVAGGRSVHAAHRPRLLAESSSGRYVAWEETGTVTFLRVWDRATNAVENTSLTDEPTGIDTGPRDSFVLTTPAGLTSVTVTRSGPRLRHLLSGPVGGVISDGTRLLVSRPGAGSSNLGGPCSIAELRGTRLVTIVPPHHVNLCASFVSLRAGHLVYTEGVGANHCEEQVHFVRTSLAAPNRGSALQLPPPPTGDFWMMPAATVSGGAVVASLIPLARTACFAKEAPTTFTPELWRYTDRTGWNRLGRVPAWDVAAEAPGRLAAITGAVHAPRGLGIPRLTGPGTLREQTRTGWRVVARGVYELAD